MAYNLEKNANTYLSTDTPIINMENNSSSSNNNKHLLYIIKLIIILSLCIFIYTNRLVEIKQHFKLPKISHLKDNNNYNIDSNYETLSPNDEKVVYIPIVGTNDIHGRFFPSNNHIYSNGNEIKFKTGGLEYIARYINILKNEYGANRVLYFDAGDQFFHTNETILFDGNNIFEFLNTIGLNGTTLGNIDYLYRREWIENKIKKASYPYLINNIKDIYLNKTKGALGDNQEQSHIYEIKLNDNDIIKIGVIGITMNIGVDKPFFNIGNRQTWNNISFLPHKTNLEEQSKQLKENGANAIILLSHIGLSCFNVKETSILNMYTKYSKQSECEHKGNSLLYNFVQNLKPGTIDAIIGGDTHNNVHHWVNDIPIMITKGEAKYVNIMYLPFKKENNKFILVNNDIKIEGPLPSCERIFTNLNHCEKFNDNNIDNNNIKLTNYYWHNKEIKSDEITKPLFDKYYNLYQEALDKKVAKIIRNTENLKMKNSGDCLLGNLMMDIIRNITNTDISIVNLGMFQSNLPSGDLTIFDFIKLIPHEYYLCTTSIKGKEIKKLIKTVQKTEKGFLPTSGLKQYIKIDNDKKEVVDIKLYSLNNKVVEIEEEKEYTLSSNNLVLSEFCKDEFALKDSFEIIKSKIIKAEIKCSKTNAFIEIKNYFKNKGTIDIKQIAEQNKKRIVILKK